MQLSYISSNFLLFWQKNGHWWFVSNIVLQRGLPMFCHVSNRNSPMSSLRLLPCPTANGIWGCRLEVIIVNELKKFFAVAPSARSLVDHDRKRNFPHQHLVMLTTTTPHFVALMVCFQQNDYLNPEFQQFSSTIKAISYSDSLRNWQKWIFYRHETGGLGLVSGRNEG